MPGGSPSTQGRLRWRNRRRGCGLGLLALLLLARPGQAQIDSGYIRSFPNGAQTSIDTEDGVRCSANGGTRPYLTMFAGYDGVPDNGLVISNSSAVTQLGTGFIGGLSITIPLGGSELGNCDRLRELQEAKSTLALANQMFEAGLLSEADLKQLGEQLKPLLLGNLPRPQTTGGSPPAAPAKSAPPAPAGPVTPLPTRPLPATPGTANPSGMSATPTGEPTLARGLPLRLPNPFTTGAGRLGLPTLGNRGAAAGR